MSTAVYLTHSGTAAAIEGKPGKRWRRDAGWQHTRNYTVPTVDEASFLSTLTGNIDDVDIDFIGPLSIVTVAYASDSSDADTDPGSSTQRDPILTAWSIGGNTHNLPLLTHPSFSGVNPSALAPYSLGQTAVARIIAYVRAYQKALDDADSVEDVDGVEDYATATILATAEQDPYFDSPFGNDTSAARLERRRFLFKELVSGNDDWEFAQPVIRKLEVVRSGSAVVASFTNIGRGYSWSRLKAAEPTLDTALIIGINTLEEMNGNEVWIWQKRFPNVDVGSDGKRTLTQEYWGWQAFDEARYGVVIT